MDTHCTYCNSLHRAIEGYNYCSMKGDSMSGVGTNAYYFKTNNLYSGEHISRMSIRTISDGYQIHQVGNKDHVLDKNRYLVINEGEEFQSQLSTNAPLEGLLVAFDKKDMLSCSSYLNNSDEKLLDDPYDSNSREITIETQSLELQDAMKELLESLKYGIVNKEVNQLYYEQEFQSVLKQIYRDHGNVERRVQGIKARRNSTKQEIFKRIRTAREYIDANLQKDLSLKDISEVATMSTFHFVRSFGDFYFISPHQYLVKKRMEKAKFLLVDSDMTAEQIAVDTGFENKTSFGRLFKQKTTFTPIEYRKLHVQ